MIFGSFLVLWVIHVAFCVWTVTILGATVRGTFMTWPFVLFWQLLASRLCWPNFFPNLLSHVEHLNGFFFSLWSSETCCCKLFFEPNFLLQINHLKGFEEQCTWLKWKLRLVFMENVLLQILHGTGFLDSWTYSMSRFKFENE